MLISVDTAAGSTREVMEGHFESVGELDPAYYPAWIAKLWYLLPRWHGTEESLREFLGEIEIQIKSHPWLFEVMLNYLDIVRGEQRDSFEWSDTKIYEPIKEAFGRRISMHPDSVYLKQRFALYAYRAEDWDRAVSLMDEAGDVYANSGWDSLETYNEYRARTYLKYARGKSNAEILRYAKRALELAPDNYWVVYDVAYTTRLITYDFHSSLALARHSIQLNSEYAPTYWLQAVELVNTNQFDAAVESAEKGLEYAKGNEIKRLLNQVLDAARERTAD